MSTVKDTISKQFRIRPSILAGCVLALGISFIIPASGSGTATQHATYQISDDIQDTTIPFDEAEGAPIPGTDDTNVPGNGNGNGNGNNGHGNNEDGVDSGNPGQGNGGPNGGIDGSCNGDGVCVDDEIGGGN